jgi:hypothetical protein
MAARNSNWKDIAAVFLPSPTGAVLYFAFAGIVLLFHQFELVRNLLQVPENVQFSRIFFNWADRALTGLIGESSTTTLVVGLFWAAVGVVVYILLLKLSRLLVELDADVSQRKFIWPRGADRTRPLKELFIRLLFRTGAIVMFLAVVTGPFAIALRGPIWGELIGPNQILRNVVWFFTIIVVTHVLVVLARLVALRQRLINF